MAHIAGIVMTERSRLGLIALTVAITWLPYLFGWLITPPNMRYLWLVYNPDDQNVHLMWARQAMDGAWRFHDLYTTELHPGLFVHLYALALGWFCRFTDIPLHFAYQLFRTFVAVAFLLAAFRFGDRCLPKGQIRQLFAWLVCFSSGLGWLPVLYWWQTGQRPPFFFVDVSPELTMPEANSFLSLTVAPLAALGPALVMVTLRRLPCLAEGEGKATVSAATAALCGALVANIHTYAAIPMLLAAAFWFVARWAQRRRFEFRLASLIAAALSPCLLILVVQALVFPRDPAFAEKAATPTLTPSPFILLGSYGIVGILALFGLPIAVRRLRANEKEWLMPLCWFLALLVAIHLPVSFQRKMIEGLHVVLCLLAALAWDEWAQRFRWLAHRWAVIALVLLTVPSQIAFFALNGYWLVNNNLLPERRLQPPYFLAERHLRLLAWIERHAEKDDAVLCHPMLGNYVPPLTGRKVFIGHWAETLRFTEKLRQATAIWQGQLRPEEAARFFERHRLRYALETDFERAAAGGKTALSRYGSLVFAVGDDKVFRLRWTKEVGRAKGAE
jgi:hypothetical protein